MSRKMVILSGPTASGKSDLAVRLALYFSVPVISADSRQVFREVNIGTAKPDAQIRKNIRHYLIDHVDVGAPYNVGQFLSDAEAVIADLYGVSEFALVCGGTGLYTRALIEGLDKFPDVDPDIAESLRKTYEQNGLESLSRQLLELDPEYAQAADLQNPHRVMRALGVILSSGQKFSGFLGKKSTGEGSEVLHLLLELPRTELYDRINRRVDKMMDAGLLEETERLQDYWGCQALDTVGYQELIRYLQGSWSLEEAVDKIKQHTRNYAKRQLTWYRKFHQGPVIHAGDEDKAVSLISEFLKKN